MQFFRFLAVLMCAEWLLIFHVWISFRYLLVFAIFCYFRGHILAFIPHWDTYYFVFLFATLGVLYHLRAVWRGRSARYRDFYTTPDAGVPWLIMVAQTPKATQLLEYVIMMAFLIYMMSYGHLIYPREFRALPPDWQAWLSASGQCRVVFRGLCHQHDVRSLPVERSSLPACRCESPKPQTPKPTRMCGKHPTRPPGSPPSRSLPTSTGSYMGEDLLTPRGLDHRVGHLVSMTAPGKQ